MNQREEIKPGFVNCLVSLNRTLTVVEDAVFEAESQGDDAGAQQHRRSAQVVGENIKRTVREWEGEGFERP